MRYIVILDVDSPVGAFYSDEGNNDGYAVGGKNRHPYIDCLEVSFDVGPYLFAKRDVPRQNDTQTLYIPHRYVVMVIGYAETDTVKPFGFTIERRPDEEKHGSSGGG